MAGDAGAVTDLKELARFTDGVLPYAPDVLKSVPAPHADKRRMDNAVALDVSAWGMWCRAGGIADDPPLTVQAQPGRHDLGTVHDHVTTLLRGRDRDAHATYGFMPGGAGAPGLKMLLAPHSDRKREKLLADARLRSALDGFIADTLRTICADHGFVWMGFVLESGTSLNRRFGDSNQWVTLSALP